MRSIPGIFAALLTVALAPSTPADVLITRTAFSEGPGAEGAKQRQEASSQIWIGKDKFREIAFQDTIVDLEASRLHLVDHRRRTYTSLELPVDFQSLASPELRERLTRMLERMNLQITVTPTKESREINGYPTTKYEIRARTEIGVEYDVDVWVTREIPVDLAGWSKLMTAAASLAPPGSDQLMKSIGGLPGFPILEETTMTLQGCVTRTGQEVISVEEKDAPLGIYDPPSSYTREPFDADAFMNGG